MSIFDSSGALANIDMSYGDHSSYPALGFNPAPGNTATVGNLARNFSTVAGHLGQAHDALVKAGQAGGFWQGEAARAFRDDVGELPDYLAKATSSFGDAGTALDGWMSDLTSLQHSAADYERQAEQAQRTLNQAKSNPDLQLAGQEFDTDQALQQAQARLNTATAELTQAEAELRAIREQAARLHAQHQDLVHEVEAALKRAKEEAPDKPGLFDRIGNAIGGLIDGAKDLAGKVWQWTKDHADVIKKIGDVLSGVGTVLSVAAACTAGIPVVGEVVAAASIGVNGAALAAHGLAKAAGANVSATTLAMDAVGMVPGGGAMKGALGATRVARVATAAGKAARFGEEGTKLARGAEAAGKAMERMSTSQLGSWAHRAQIISKVVPNLSEKIGVSATKLGEKTFIGTEKTLYKATNTAGHVAGGVMGGLEKTAIQVGKWEAQPYIDNARDSAADFYDKLSNGERPSSAAKTFDAIANGHR